MRRFFCCCGQELFFDNTYCQACGRSVGYDPGQRRLLTLEPLGGDLWQVAGDTESYRHCRNRVKHGVCNSLVPEHTGASLCLCCALNRTIPDLSHPANLKRWGRIEQAKRRLIYGLLGLGLPLQAPAAGFPRGLCFDFLEDRRSNPAAHLDFVTTGHQEGVITLNVLEADDVQRAWQREQSSELYRTLLGHFRHEAGHYYFELLVQDREAFRVSFGDPDMPYEEALRHYYQDGPLAGWESGYISAYASAHPQEDWAECFAHYLHMIDTIETAAARGVIFASPGTLEEMLVCWDGLAVSLNELNRSLGVRDAYPFVVTPAVAQKVRFVHGAITRYRGT